jgi:hypothetical protein
MNMRGLGILGVFIGVALLILAIPAIDALRGDVADASSGGTVFMFGLVMVFAVLGAVYAVIQSLNH